MRRLTVFVLAALVGEFCLTVLGSVVVPLGVYATPQYLLGGTLLVVALAYVVAYRTPVGTRLTR